VVDAARHLDVGALPDDVTTVPGKGVVATLGGRRVAVGNLALLAAEGADDVAARPAVERLAHAGRTPMAVALDGRVLGVVAVADEVRADAAEAVRRLHAAGVRTVMLTGDQQRVAAAVAAEVGMTDVRAALLPEDKLDAVR